MNLNLSDARCATENQVLWFPDARQGHWVPAMVHKAAALCHVCPLRAPCLAGAIERREATGIWGGRIFVNGRAHTRIPRRGPRIPAHDLAGGATA